MPAPVGAGAIISGKWEFSNGMNVNLSQDGSQLTGTATLVVPSASLTGAIVDELCSPNSIMGQISGLQVTLTQNGTCDTAPAGGYTTQTTVNAAGTEMTGGVWGNGFLVGSVTGTYSGSDVVYEGPQTISSTGTLVLHEDQSHNVTGTFVATPTGVSVPLAGTAVGGCLNLSNRTLVGEFQLAGSVNITAIISPPLGSASTVVGTLCPNSCP